jgi:hypothetical protein
MPRLIYGDAGARPGALPLPLDADPARFDDPRRAINPPRPIWQSVYLYGWILKDVPANARPCHAIYLFIKGMTRMKGN